MTRKSKRALVLIAIAVLVSGIALFQRPPPPALVARNFPFRTVAVIPPAPPPPETSGQILGAEPALQAGDEYARAPAVTIGRTMIKRVRFYPTRICAGRPFLVHVEAHDPDGYDGLLVYDIHGERGNPAVLTYEEPGAKWVPVSAFNLRGDYDQRQTLLKIQDCDDSDEPLTVRLFGAGPVGIAAFEVTLPRRAAPDVPWRYQWDFGDGQSAVTDQPYVEHDYRERPQRSLMSTFLVRVVAKSQLGEIEGMTSVPIVNLYAVNRSQKGLLVPEVIVMASGIEAGYGFIDASVIQWETEPLQLMEVRSARLVSCDGRMGTEIALDSSILDVRELRPGRNALRLRLSIDTIRDACGISMEVGGPGLHGMPVRMYLGGWFRLPEPRRALSEKSELTTEERALMGRLNKAAALLGKDLSRADVRISDAEIAALERSGKL